MQAVPCGGRQGTKGDSSVICVDLETISIDNAAAFVKPAANLKDEAKKAASIEERAAKAALNPWLCRIVALGWCEETDDVEHVEVCNNEATEARILREFWARAVDERGKLRPLVFFNGLSFDGPVLVARSMLLNVRHPEVNLDRFRSPHIDLFQKLTFGDREKALSLKFFCERFGINTDDAFTGAMIGQLYADGDWESIRRHCASDVRLTRQLAERLGVMKPRPVAA